MAKFKWGLFVILVSGIVSIVLHPYIGIGISVVGYLFVFLDKDVWDRPDLEIKIKYLNDEVNRLNKDIIRLERKIENTGNPKEKIPSVDKLIGSFSKDHPQKDDMK